MQIRRVHSDTYKNYNFQENKNEIDSSLKKNEEEQKPSEGKMEVETSDHIIATTLKKNDEKRPLLKSASLQEGLSLYVKDKTPSSSPLTKISRLLRNKQKTEGETARETKSKSISAEFPEKSEVAEKTPRRRSSSFLKSFSTLSLKSASENQDSKIILPDNTKEILKKFKLLMLAIDIILPKEVDKILLKRQAILRAEIGVKCTDQEKLKELDEVSNHIRNNNTAKRNAITALLANTNIGESNVMLIDRENVLLRDLKYFLINLCKLNTGNGNKDIIPKEMTQKDLINILTAKPLAIMSEFMGNPLFVARIYGNNNAAWKIFYNEVVCNDQIQKAKIDFFITQFLAKDNFVFLMLEINRLFNTLSQFNQQIANKLRDDIFKHINIDLNKITSELSSLNQASTQLIEGLGEKYNDPLTLNNKLKEILLLSQLTLNSFENDYYANHHYTGQIYNLLKSTPLKNDKQVLNSLEKITENYEYLIVVLKSILRSQTMMEIIAHDKESNEELGNARRGKEEEDEKVTTFTPKM